MGGLGTTVFSMRGVVRFWVSWRAGRDMCPMFAGDVSKAD